MSSGPFIQEYAAAMSRPAGWKHLFSHSLAAQAPGISFSAHGHHLWPDVTLEAQLAAWRDASALAGGKWDKVLGPVWEEAQGHVALELNLPDPRTVVFAGNAHDLLVRIFSAIAAKPVQILSSRQEFLSAMRQFRRWEETGDAIVTLVDAEDMVEAAATRQFDLIYLSQIFYDSGHESTWRRLATYARPEGPWVVIDGYHGFMAVPTDLGEVADHIFYIAGGYKYAMSGEGVGILHAPPDFGPRPRITGWFAETNQSDVSPNTSVRFARDARRFLGSTFDPSGLYRFNAVRRMLQEQSLTTETIGKYVRELQLTFIAGAEMLDLEFVRPRNGRSAAARVVDLFSRSSSRGGSHFELRVDDGRQAPIPAALADIVKQAAQMLSEGRAVALMPEEDLLTTQKAADLLNVSRQYLVRLVDDGQLPAVKIGRHRRVRPSDVAAYKAERDARRGADLDRLVALSEEAGGYDLEPLPK